MNRKIKFVKKSNQSGMALITVVILLLLASLIVLFAVNFGTLTQRISGNDVRSRLVQQTADSALSQASETILANSSILNNPSLWVACGATETAFPCGAIPEPRRASMYRFNGGTSVNGVFPDTNMDARMLDLNKANLATVNNSALNKSDGFAVNYGVGVVMCRLKPSAVGVAPVCSLDESESIKVFAITLVAVAAMPDEGARATAVRSFATSPAFGFGVDSPTTTASGLIDLKGGIQIVASPNAGGYGVPISLWTRGNIDPGGTPDTCHIDEFYRGGAPSAEANGFLSCDDCKCNAGQLTKTQGSGCSGGIDLLSGGSAPCGSNDPIKIDDPNEFPCDLFEYVFGVPAWKDVNPEDNFCETKIIVTDSYGPIGADESFLAQKADWIISSNNIGGRLPTDDPRKLENCDNLSGKSGLIWDRVGCSNNLTDPIGTSTAPVLLVYDPPGLFTWHTKLFGLLFIREPSTEDLIGKTSGSADMKVNAGVAIYGALVVQGQVKGNGSAALVHNREILTNLRNNLNKPDVLALPGSWSDNVRY